MGCGCAGSQAKEQSGVKRQSGVATARVPATLSPGYTFNGPKRREPKSK